MYLKLNSKKGVLNHSLSIIHFYFIKSRQYLGITRLSPKMANTGCVGDHPKHLFGDGVARNHSLSPEEESCRRGELRNPLVLFVVNLYACFKTFAQYLISLSSVFGILLSVLSTLYVYETKKEEYEDSTFSGASMDWFLLGK